MDPDSRLPTAQLIARWTLVLLGLSVVWRVTRLALSFPIWGDEAFVGASLLTRDFGEMLEPLAHFQIVPLGFMWVELAVSRVLGAGPTALRVAPALAGLASLYVFWRVAPRLLDRRSAFLAVAFFAASYYPIRHATEIKPYSFDLLAGLLLIASTWAVWREPRRWRRWFGFGLVAVTAVWFSYPSVFVSGGGLAALTAVVLRRRSRAVTAAWLSSGIALVVSFVAMYLIVAKGQEHAGESLYAAGSWGESFLPIDEPWRLPIWFISTHTGNLLAYPVGGRDGRSLVTFVLVLVGVVSVWRRRRPVALLLLAPFALTLVAALLQRYPYGGSARVAQHLAPMICLFAGAGLVAVARRIGGAAGANHAVGATPWVMAAIILIGIARDFRQPYKGIDDQTSRTAMTWLRTTREPGDIRVSVGGFDPTRDGLDMNRWGGRAARVRYELLFDRPGRLLWSPPVEELPRDAVLWLVVYSNILATDSDTEWLNAYVEAARRRLGTPESTRFELDPEYDEWVEFHRFDPAGTAADAAAVETRSNSP